MPEEKPKATSCPNCLKPAIRVGNEVTCEHCDAIFVITKKQGAKVKDFGQLRDHEERLKKLEALTASEQAPEKPEQETEPEEDL